MERARRGLTIRKRGGLGEQVTVWLAWFFSEVCFAAAFAKFHCLATQPSVHNPSYIACWYLVPFRFSPLYHNFMPTCSSIHIGTSTRVHIHTYRLLFIVWIDRHTSKYRSYAFKSASLRILFLSYCLISIPKHMFYALFLKNISYLDGPQSLAINIRFIQWELKIWLWLT